MVDPRGFEERLQALEEKTRLKKKRERAMRPKRPVTREQVEKFQGNRQVRIVLQDRHSINGVTYGPGEVLVSRNLAKCLLDNDQRSVTEEMRFRGGGRAFVVGPGRGRSYSAAEVHPDTFESAVNTRDPALVNPHHQGA